MLAIFLGHERIAAKILPPALLNAVTDSPLFTIATYLLLIGSVFYPFIVAGWAAVITAGPTRRGAMSAVSVTGVALIMAATWWLGQLPSTFRIATAHEDKVEVTLIGGKLRIGEGPVPELGVGILVTNPTAKLLLIPADGLSLRLKLSSDGSIIPQNTFFVHFLDEKQSPFIAVSPNGAAWVEGRIRPDYRDWLQLSANHAKQGSVAVETALLDNDGKRVTGDFTDASIEGPWPETK